MTAPGVPVHSHCEICHEPVEVADRFCGSVACREKHEANVREKKRAAMRFVALIVGAILLIYLMRGL